MGAKRPSAGMVRVWRGGFVGAKRPPTGTVWVLGEGFPTTRKSLIYPFESQKFPPAALRIFYFDAFGTNATAETIFFLLSPAVPRVFNFYTSGGDGLAKGVGKSNAHLMLGDGLSRGCVGGQRPSSGRVTVCSEGLWARSAHLRNMGLYFFGGFLARSAK